MQNIVFWKRIEFFFKTHFLFEQFLKKNLKYFLEDKIIVCVEKQHMSYFFL